MNKVFNFYSPSKLNLGLRVIGKNNNNYHLLNTVFCFINLLDKIKIEINYNSEIKIFNTISNWHFETDLTYKASVILKNFTNSQNGVNISIYKNIPVGAGLGGGSSNCATVLYALNKIWNINLSIEELQRIGLSLGADVPFFLNKYNSYATNIGEVLTQVNLPPSYFVLLKPDVSISTKLIFENLNFPNELLLHQVTPEELLLEKKNDLQNVIIEFYPELKKIIDHLKLYGNPVFTGSGSVIYLQYFNYFDAKKVANILRMLYNIYLVKGLQQNPIFLI